MNWKVLDNIDQLDTIVERSKSVPVAIFKHSVRCSISYGAKNQLENSWDLDENKVEIYYLDLIKYRPISNAIAQRFGVVHQSPQMILLRNGEVIHNASHYNISKDKVVEALAS